jgi:hypothetical protein
MVNVGEQPVPMNVFLSYGERDKLRNQRHTTTTDAPNGLGADEYPLLSLYVMKSTVPDRRYVGGALPLVHASARYDASSMPDRRYLGYLGGALPSCMQVLTTTPPSTSPQVRGRALPLCRGVCRALGRDECMVRLGSMDPRSRRRVLDTCSHGQRHQPRGAPPATTPLVTTHGPLIGR